VRAFTFAAIICGTLVLMACSPTVTSQASAAGSDVATAGDHAGRATVEAARDAAAEAQRAADRAGRDARDGARVAVRKTNAAADAARRTN
jgi:hypothetical protein